MVSIGVVRVVHVAPTPFGADGLFGGGERYPLELARALARRDDVDCELVTFGPRPTVSTDEATGLRVRVLRAAAHFDGHPAHPIGRGLLAAVTGADIVHTHHLRSAPSRMAAVAARLTGTPVVTTDHGLGGGGWLGLLPRLFDGFLTVSDYSARVLQAPDAKTHVVYGGADPERFRPDPEEERDGILFVGRLTPHKGVDQLLQALPDGATLTIAGTGGHDRKNPERDYPDHLRHLAANGANVHFLGPVAEQDLPAVHRRAAVLVLPSVDRTCYGRPVAISELLGLSVIEGMASGTPVVASRIGGLPEVVVDGETGFLVPPGDVGALADRLTALLADPALRRRLGDNSRALAVERFTWDACARRCVDAYREVLSRETPGRRRRRRATPTP